MPARFALHHALVLGLAAGISATPALADWPAGGDAVCVAPCEEVVTSSIADGNGGMYLTWNDNRLCGQNFAFIQHLDRHGAVAAGWPALGKPVCTAASGQSGPQLAPDGQGGAIVMWIDSRTGYYAPFAERFAANGTALWDPAGVAVCTSTGDQVAVRMMPDGAGGAYLAWRDHRKGLDAGPPHHIRLFNPFAQHLDASGARAWGAAGVAVGDNLLIEAPPALMSDGGTGVLVAWGDGAGVVNLQRFDVAGSRQLGNDGVLVAGLPFGRIISDGAGGLIDAFMTGGDGTYDLWAQRVDGAGNVLWGAGGKVIAAAAFDQRPNDIVADGAGGAYVTWYDLRNGADWDVYVQRLTSAGDAAVGWPAGGMDLTPVPGFQIYPRVIADNDGACFVSWYDARGIANAYDIYAQRINANGTLTQGWATGGVAVCSAAGDQDYPVLASDGSHGVLVAWQDWRTDGDVYAQRVRFNGALGDTLPTNGVGPAAPAEFAIGSVFPNPSRTGALRVALALPNGAPARLSLFDPQGRLVTGRTVQLAGGGRATLALAAPERLAAGVYLLRLEQFGRTATRSVSIMK